MCLIYFLGMNQDGRIENCSFAPGFDHTTIRYIRMLVDKLDQAKKTEVASGSAFEKFKRMDSRAESESTGVKLDSVHQNSINCIRCYDRDQSTGNVTKFSTSGMDGKVVIWDIRSIEASIASLTIQ